MTFITRWAAPVTFAASCIPAVALADEPGAATPVNSATKEYGTAGLNWFVEAGFEFGGDDVAKVIFTNGDDQDLEAGQGLFLAGGAHYRPAATSPWDFTASLGYKFATTAADNADIGIDRITLELFANYDLSNEWFVGVGLINHSGIELDGDGFFQDVEFDNATGIGFKIGWRYISLTYKDISYEVKNGGGAEADASNIGLNVLYRF